MEVWLFSGQWTLHKKTGSHFHLLMLGLHYVPGSHGSHGSQKRSSPWRFSHFCLCVQVLLSLTTFSHGLPWQRLAGALRSVTDGSTFHPDLSRSVGTSYVLLRCDQVLLRLSSSVKVFYDKTWAMNGVWAPICTRYKEEVHKAAAIVILCTLDQKHHYM